MTTPVEDVNARLDFDCPRCGALVVIMGRASDKVWACDACGLGFRRTEEGVEEVAPKDYNAPAENVEDKEWAVMADLGRLRHEGNRWDLDNVEIKGSWLYLMLLIGFGALAGCVWMWAMLQNWLRSKGVG